MSNSAAERAEFPPPNYSETIEVIVGEEEKRYMVYKGIVCERSPWFRVNWFFARALGGEGTFELPQHDALTFEGLLHWVYSSRLDLNLLAINGVVEVGTLGKVWSLAHHVFCFELCNLVIVACMRVFEAKIAFWDRVSFDKFPLGSNIRRMMVDFLAANVMEVTDEDLAGLPVDVTVAVLRKLSAGETEPSIEQRETSEYYEPVL